MVLSNHISSKAMDFETVRFKGAAADSLHIPWVMQALGLSVLVRPFQSKKE